MEADTGQAALAALAAAGMPAVLVEGVAPFRVRWANDAFIHAMGLGAATENHLLLDLVGEPNEGLASILERLPHEGPRSVVVGSRSDTPRHERELTLLPVPAPGKEAAILVLVRDVTEREAAQRRLEAENFRLTHAASVTRQVVSLDSTRIVAAAVGATHAISNGPTAVYLVGREGMLTRTATAGVSAATAALLPRAALPGRLRLMRKAIHSGNRQSLPYAPGLPEDEKLGASDPDLILCDLRMPVMDGFEFVRHVRADPGRAALPVLAVSGFGSEESRDACREAGFDAYVGKPVDSSTLVASIRNALRARRKAS